MSQVSLVQEAMSATVAPADRGWPIKTTPPRRRAGTCFAGWKDHEIRAFLEYMTDQVGVSDTAFLLSVSVSTVRRGLRLEWHES